MAHAPADLDEEALADYLAGCLAVSGANFEDRTAGGARAIEWFRHLQGFGFDTVPFFAVHDVGHLLLLLDAFPFRAVTDLDGWSEAERPVRLAYENRFLNALRTDPRFRRMAQVLARQAAWVPPRPGGAAERRDERPEAEDARRRTDALVQRALEILFAPLREARLPDAPRINPVHLRDAALGLRVATTPGVVSLASHVLGPGGGGGLEEARARFEAARPAFFLDHLAAFVESHVPRVDVPRLVREEDFFELAHFEALDRPHRRLFARRVQELVTAAGPIDVARTQVRVESQEASTAVADEGSYPTGGIGEITTRGSIENLVRSEMLYWQGKRETDVAVPGGSGAIDLFALRWAEGDLLYYTRDSGALHRKRRNLVFAIEPAQLRIKDPRHTVSLAVLAYALIARTAEDLFELFGGEGARVELRLVSPDLTEADREEMQLFALRMKEPMRRGDAAMLHGNFAAATPLADPRRRTFVVAVGEVALDAREVERQGASLLRVRLSAEPEPLSRGDTVGTPEGHETVLRLDPAAPDPGLSLAAVRDALLTRVVGVR